MRVTLGSDHAGWKLKEEIKAFLLQRGCLVDDFSRGDEQRVDYTEVGLAACLPVSRGERARGVLVCGTGLGMTILANKLPGIRACLCHDSYSARMSRAHNDCNVLVLGGRVVGPDLARQVVGVWLDTPFEGGRHAARLARISELERTVSQGE